MKKMFLAIALVAMMSSCGGNASKEEALKDKVDMQSTELADSCAKESEGAVVELTDVAQLKTQGKPIVIDFTATWCGPCQRLKPHFNALSEKMADKVTFIKVDVDKWKDLALEYGAQSVPTIVVVNADGKKTSTVGYMEEDELEKFILNNI